MPAGCIAGCLRAVGGHNPEKLRGEIQALTGKTVALSDVPSVAAASDSAKVLETRGR